MVIKAFLGVMLVGDLALLGLEIVQVNEYDHPIVCPTLFPTSFLIYYTTIVLHRLLLTLFGIFLTLLLNGCRLQEVVVGVDGRLLEGIGFA